LPNTVLKLFSDYAKMKQAEANALIVTTTNFHKDVAVKGLESGAHVLVENLAGAG
jgi:predicted dehydrogenase